MRRRNRIGAATEESRETARYGCLMKIGRRERKRETLADSGRQAEEKEKVLVDKRKGKLKFERVAKTKKKRKRRR